MAASPLTFFNLHRSPYLHSSASSSSSSSPLSSPSSSSSSSSLDSFIFVRRSSYNSTSRNFLERSTLSYCKSSSFGNLSWIYGRKYSKGPEKSAGVRGTIEIQANLSSSTPPSASSSSYSSYTVEDESKFSDIKIVRHGNAVLEDIPHLTDWLPDLPTYNSPLTYNPVFDSGRYYFVGPDDVVAKNVVLSPGNQGDAIQRYFRRAGPRGKVYFKPGEVRACIVTCGGLCPGLNTVIREIVCGLWNQYGVQDILGIEGGYRGFYARNTVRLTPKTVNDIHKRGGTVLGTSRGGHDTTKIVNSIEDRGINQVYIIGGDGTQKGAAAIYKEVRKRGLKVNIVGIPKTIDNDIAIIDRSFGFDTAVEEAQRAINAAHTEAESTHNGIGLVKLMGRHSGYIAMFATLASRDVDLCLIPEVPFYLEGKGGLYEFVERRLRENGHMVIVVAEGAGQELLKTSGQESARDESGNQVLLDVGLWLSQKLKDYFISTKKGSLNLKYIDPTYMIRAIPSNASDNVYCTLLAQSGIHGAMAGYTGFTVAPVNGRHAYIPISRVTEKQNRVNVYDRMWARLLSTTNQPAFIDAEKDDEETPAPSSLLSPQGTHSVLQESRNGAIITEMELDTMVNAE